MAVSTRNASTSLKDCGKDACYGRFFSMFYCAAAIHAALVRFSEDPDIVRSFVHLDDGVGENAEPLNRVRRAVWDMLYADYALSPSQRKASRR